MLLLVLMLFVIDAVACRCCLVLCVIEWLLLLVAR